MLCKSIQTPVQIEEQDRIQITLNLDEEEEGNGWQISPTTQQVNDLMHLHFIEIKDIFFSISWLSEAHCVMSMLSRLTTSHPLERI